MLICELCSDTSCERKPSNKPYNNYSHQTYCTILDSEKLNKTEDCPCKKKGHKYIIKGMQLNQLRWNVTSYLNNLETVFTAYCQGIVDKKAIETQFSFLYRPEKIEMH